MSRAPTPDLADLHAAVETAEALLAAGTSTEAPAGVAEALVADLGALQAAGIDVPKGLRKRVHHVAATVALRSRELPRDALAGVGDAAWAAAQGEGHVRSRMSTAFLEAPHALRRWRWMAVGSTLCLILGAAWVLSRTSPPTPDGTRPLAPIDPRHDLLTPWAAQDMASPLVPSFDALPEDAVRAGESGDASSRPPGASGPGALIRHEGRDARPRARGVPGGMVWISGDGSVRMRLRGVPLPPPAAETPAPRSERN